MENISSEQEIPVQKSNVLGLAASSSVSKSYPILKSSTPRTLDKIASGPVTLKDSIVIKENNNTATPEPLQERMMAPKENFEIPDLGSLESINSNSSKSVYLSVLLNILFIASFLLEFQTGSANRMNLAIQKEIDGFPYSTEPLLYLSNASTMSDVSFFLNHVILSHVLDSDRVYTPTNYKNTLNQSIDSTWISSTSSGQTQNPETSQLGSGTGSGTGSGSGTGAGSETESGTGTGAGSGTSTDSSTGTSTGSGVTNGPETGTITPPTVSQSESGNTTPSSTTPTTSTNTTQSTGSNTGTTGGNQAGPQAGPPPFRRVLRHNEQIETESNFIGILEDDTDDDEDEILRNLQASSTSNTTPYYFLNSFNLFKGMLITFYFNDQSPFQGTEFTLFYEATISSLNAYNQSRRLLKGLQNGYIKSVNIEIEFLNVIKQIGVYYRYTFEQDDQAEFQMSTDARPFYPKVLDKDYYDSTSRTLIIIFRVLFALSLLVQLVKVVAVDIYKAFKTLFQTHKLHLPLDVVYDICLVILLIIVLILSFDESLRQKGTCTLLETIDRKKFLLFKSFANFHNFFVRLLSVTIAFLIIQILLLLNTQFPTFGILFYTLGQSKNKLATYGILILTLMAGFVSLMTLNFGQGDVSMDTFGKSLFLVFQYMVGGAEYKQLKAANDKLAGLYFLVFYIIFNLLIILLFIAIIMATYAQLRKKLQITTLALAELMAEKSKKLKEKYLNLILFRAPKQETLDEESLKRRRLSVLQIQQLKNQQEHKKKNLGAILLQNLEELDWFGCTNNHHMTRDEIENQVKAKIIEIRKRQIQKEQDKINERKTSVFGKLMNLLIHLIFIVVYTYTLNYELKRPQSFEINQAIGDYFLKSVFFSEDLQVNKTFNDITTVEDIIQWTREVYFNGIFEAFTDSDNSTTISSVYSQNSIISSAVSRINFRNLQMYRSNEVENSKTSFYVRSANDISASDKHSSSEVQDEIVFPEMTIDYTPSGTLSTFRQEGGYYCTFPRNKTLAQEYANKIQHPKLLNINTGLMTLQTVYLNGNYELLGLCEFIISIKASGYIQKDYKTHVFQVNLSSCPDCRAKIVLEVIYILFVLKQIYDLVQQFREEWNKKESKKLTPINKKFINRSWLVQVLNHDVEKSKFLSTLGAVFLRLWQLLNRFITTTLNFWKKTYANLILSVSIILTLCCFYYYLKIVLQGFRKEVDLGARPSDSTDSFYRATEIGNYEELATLTNSYATLQAFNSWLIILRLLFEFGFSRELSFILDLIYGSLFDILFFSLTFLIIIFGFAIDGFLIFGPEAEGFKDLGSAFLQILIWIISGRITDETVNEKIDSGTKAVFFIFLIVICLLILLKMFMAILDSQFMSLAASEFEAEHLGFVELIAHIIGEKVRGQKIELKVIPTPPNVGKLNKMRIQFMNKFYKTRYAILTRLKKTILQDEDNTLSEEEFKKRAQAAEDNKVAVHLDFRTYGGKEQREIELDDLQFYLRDANQPELTRGFSSVKNKIPEIPIVEDPFLNPAKWMNYLEENVQKVTSEKIKLAKYGGRALDYVSLERKINPEIEQRLQNILNEAMKQYPDDIITPQFFAENIAIPEYKKILKDKQKPNLYSTISDHINFIYYKVLNQFGDAFSDAQANIDTPIESPFGQKHIKKKMMKLDHHIYREEHFNLNDSTLLSFWEALKIKHQYELWAGDHRDLLSDDIRSCLWKLMKFDGALFTPYIDQKIFKNRGLSSKAIGLVEIHWIWHSLTCASTTTSPRENLSESEDIPNSNIDELSIKHMNLTESLIRGDDENLIVKLRKNNTLKGKLKYLSSLKRVKNDKKLMLWLLTPLNKKTDIILRIRDPVLLRFTFFLLLEEVYDNSHLIHTVETGLNQEIKNKIYMFFFFFSHFEALQHNMKTQKFLGSPENNTATIEYIQFLEKQVESTNNVKKQYLRDINMILQKENEMKQQEDLVFSREDSGIPSSQQSFSPEKSRLTENPLFLRDESGASSPQKGFSPVRPLFTDHLDFFKEDNSSPSPQKSYSPEKSRFTENEEKELFLQRSFLTPQRVQVKEKEEEVKEEENSPPQELAVLPDELDMHFESSSDEESGTDSDSSDSSSEGQQETKKTI